MNIIKQTMTILKTFPSAFGVLVIATFFNQLGNMVQVFLVLYLTMHLHFSVVHTSFVFAIFGISVFFTNFVGGAFIDRVGALKLMVIVLFLNAFVLFNFVFIKNYHAILILCIIWGWTYGLFRPCAQTFLISLIPPDQIKVGFSVYRLALNLGMSIGPAVGGYLAYHSFAAIFVVNALSNLIAVTILLVGLKNIGYLNVPMIKKKWEFGFTAIRADRLLRIYLLGMIPISMVFFQHDSTMSLYINDLHLSLQFYGLLFTLNTLIIVFFELPLNVATINWPLRWSLGVGSFFITLGFFSIVFVKTAAGIIFLTIIWTIGEMILYPAASSYVAEIAPVERRGVYMSLSNICNTIGLFLGPWCGLLIIHHFSMQAVWIVCGIWGMLSTLILGGLLREIRV